MANNNEKKGVDDRRDFLKKAALSVAAAGTAAVASKAASADEARQLVAQYEEAIREKVKETEERKKHEFTIAMVNVRRACRSRLGPP